MYQHILTILLLCLPLCALSQSKESNKLYKQGIDLFNAEKYKEAVPYFQKSDSLDKAQLAPTSENYYRAELKLADCWHQLAGVRAEDGKYAEAIRLVTAASEIQKKALGGEHPDYATSLNDLAIYYYYVGNYQEAIKNVTQAIEIRKKVLGEEHLDYARSLSNLANYNYELGNYQEAIRLGIQAKEIRKKILGENHIVYAQSLGNLAAYYDEIGNHKEAVSLGRQVIEISKNVLGEDHPYYAQALNNLAVYYNKVGNYQEAVRLGNQALELFKNAFGEEDPNYAWLLTNLALYASKTGNYAEAIRLGTIGLGLTKRILGEEHPDYDIPLCDLADYYFADGNYDNAVKCYKRSYNCKSSFILKYFSSMTNKERANYWNKYDDFFIKDLPYVAYKINNAELTELAYNGQVLSKGLLLNAELEIQKLIEQSHDATFVNRYNKIKQDREILDELYQLAPDERPMDADSLYKVIDNEERLLVQSSKELGDYTKNLSIDWHDIQKQLNDNDLAVEFANFKDTSIKQQVYVAFVLKKGMKSPEIVKLFESDAFYDIKTADYYKTTKLYNLVWKPLAHYLDGVKTIYFSPAGQFHTIGIEYLPDEKGTIFAEKYDAYRLSSTRELALERESNTNKTAATYGGIQYDMNVANANQRNGAMGYLDGTKEESAAVVKLLRADQYKVTALSDTLATEASLKKLSGNNLKILHIGTHGFYFNEADMENAGYKFFTSSQQSDEDKALSCSGLLFAGANAALDLRNSSDIAEGDDGVLTAKEISRLDFNGLDLVVLSACQTGLGEVKGEGVFGLQRGFKKAGAQTIVMSLWKVFDESTQLLMTEFFKNLTAGQSKRAAFQAAQKTVRAKYPDPQHWAAFVMVDGL